MPIRNTTDGARLALTGDTTSFGNDTDITFAGWYYCTGASQLHPLFQIDDGSVMAGLAVYDAGPGHKLQLWAGAFDPAPRVTGSTALSTGTWYYVALTRSGSYQSATWTLYRGDESNAVASHGTYSEGASPQVWPTGGTKRVVLGWASTSFAALYASQGVSLAYWRIWTSALDSTALEAERLSKSAVTTASLWAEYDFASEATKSTDSSGSAHHLDDTVTGTWVDQDGSPTAAQAEPSGLSEPSSGAPIPLFMTLGVG